MIGMAGYGVKKTLTCEIQQENVQKLRNIQSNQTKHIHGGLAPKVATNWKICNSQAVKRVQNRIVCARTQNWKRAWCSILHLHLHLLCIPFCTLKILSGISYPSISYFGFEKERLATVPIRLRSREPNPQVHKIPASHNSLSLHGLGPSGRACVCTL